MAKLATREAEAVDLGIGMEAAEELGGYKVGYVQVRQDADLTPLLKGLPGDQCHSPHWGYVFKGRIWWRFDDREEEHLAGDAFYVPSGHTAGADAGSEFVIFSPTEAITRVEEHMARRAAELQAS